MLDADLDAEKWWNVDEEGMPKRTADEIYAEREQSLIDSINRVPCEPIEAADKGTCFNEAVDAYIHSCGSSRDDVVLRSRLDEQFGEVIDATMDGFVFTFDYDLVKEASQRFSGAVSQYLCSALIKTRFGVVELYGYADEIVKDKVVDIKTTSKYEFGDFARKWQKDVYPYCLVESGLMVPTMFEYAVFQWNSRKGEPLKAAFYAEQYMYDHAAASERLRKGCEQFIEWLEAHSDRITDRKIFGGETH